MLQVPRLIDAHTHIQFAAYKDDRDKVIKRSLEAGVWLVNVGTQKDTSAEAVALAEKYNKGVYATVGLHPIHTDKSFHDEAELGLDQSFTSRGDVFDYEFYKKLASHKKVVAIGECGLDYYRATSDRGHETKEKQKDAFYQQIELSKELKKPLMIHCREAFPDLIDILVACRMSLVSGSIVHFFSGTEREANQLLDMGLFFTFGGVITFVRDYDEIIKAVPINRILLETDAPYVTPAPYRGQRNEPLYVAEVAKKLAEIKDVSLDEIYHHTTENARNIFGI